MAHLRFTADAESQLHQAHQLLNGTDRQASYDRLVATLVNLERDASLFTLLEATSIPNSIPNLYAVVLDADPPAMPVALAYGLDESSEDVVIFTISW